MPNKIPFHVLDDVPITIRKLDSAMIERDSSAAEYMLTRLKLGLAENPKLSARQLYNHLSKAWDMEVNLRFYGNEPEKKPKAKKAKAPAKAPATSETDKQTFNPSTR